VDVDGAVEGLVDGGLAHVRRGHVAVHVEVDRVAAFLEGLAYVEELCVGDTRYGGLAVAGLVLACEYEDDCAEVVGA